MIEDLGLGEFIDQGTAGYALAMADAMARYQNGEHILFYTWTPNWTVNELVPGEDVVWIGLEEPSHPEDLSEEALTANGLEGAVTDSLIMGFPPNDIQVVANSEFLDNNPAAAALFEAMELTLGDIAQQNAQMQDGENSQEDIEQHATEWIAANQETWDAWIQAALDAA